MIHKRLSKPQTHHVWLPLILNCWSTCAIPYPDSSKCVHEDETGKMFSALAVIAATVPMIAFPAMRLFYNKTLDIFPAAEVLLTTSIVLVATVLNFLIYTQRWRISSFNSHYEDDPKANPSIDTIYSKANYQLHQF